MEYRHNQPFRGRKKKESSPSPAHRSVPHFQENKVNIVKGPEILCGRDMNEFSFIFS